MDRSVRMEASLNEALSTFTYMDNFTFKAIPFNGVLTVEARAAYPASSGRQDRLVRTASHWAVEPEWFDGDGILTPEGYAEFIWFMRNFIRFRELHELDEFIKVGGKQVFHPHEEERAVNEATLSIHAMPDVVRLELTALWRAHLTHSHAAAGSSWQK